MVQNPQDDPPNKLYSTMSDFHHGNGIDATNDVGPSPSSLPKLYSTIDEVENDLLRPQKQKQQRPLQQPPSNDEQQQKHDEHYKPSSFQNYQAPHLFLHFDVNETILIGDPAGGDSVEECLNTIIAKSTFVSVGYGRLKNGDNTIGRQDKNDASNNDEEYYVEAVRSPSSTNIFAALEPTHWWNGLPLHSTNNKNDTNRETGSPPPLYTGWTWPTQTCPYYHTNYKRLAKQFTNSSHGRMYRPLYEKLGLKLGLNLHHESGEPSAIIGGEQFKNFLPAFFNALQYYFPSSISSSSDSSSNNENSNHHPTSKNNLPPPSKVTLVLRTFGKELPRVAKCISEFAKGNHPSYPHYYNADLILEDRDLFCGKWNHRDKKGNSGKMNLIYDYEIHPANDNNKNTFSNDDQVLDYLQSKSIVGIQDRHPAWRPFERDQKDAPWAGQPVWARADITAADAATSPKIQHQYNHHHILLHNNSHNDPNDDGAAGSSVRIPMIDLNDDNNRTTYTKKTTTTAKIPSYDSLHGDEALNMHGKHLIRVPTIRPLLEDDWFVRQIEEARWKIFVEEDDRNQKDRNQKDK